MSYTITHQDEPRSSLSSQDLTIFAPPQEREVYFVVVRFVLQMLHFAVGVIDERALFGQTLYMLQYQSHLSNGTRMVRDIERFQPSQINSKRSRSTFWKLCCVHFNKNRVIKQCAPFDVHHPFWDVLV